MEGELDTGKNVEGMKGFDMEWNGMKVPTLEGGGSLQRIAGATAAIAANVAGCRWIPPLYRNIQQRFHLHVDWAEEGDCLCNNRRRPLKMKWMMKRRGARRKKRKNWEIKQEGRRSAANGPQEGGEGKWTNGWQKMQEI
jgi:hypothetical protein